MIYYIYHIEGVKIGCTIEPKERVRVQGYNVYTILEEHNDIYIASDREIELQKQYGYPIDNVPYWKTIKFQSKAYTIKVRPKRKIIPIESIEERTQRIKNLHIDMKSRGVGFYKKGNPMKAGLVSKAKFSIAVLVYQYPSMKYVGEYTSAKDAGRQLGISNIGNIRNVLKGRGKSLAGYTFNYKP